MKIIAGDEETYSELKNNLRYFDYPFELLKQEMATEENEYCISYGEDIYIQIIKIDQLRLNKLQKQININNNKFKRASGEINKLKLQTPKSRIFKFSEFLKLDFNIKSFNDNFFDIKSYNDDLFGTDYKSYNLIPFFEQQKYEYLILEEEFKNGNTFYCAWFNYGKSYRKYKFLPIGISETSDKSIKPDQICEYEIPSLDYIVFYLKSINIELKSLCNKEIEFIFPPIDMNAEMYTYSLISEIQQDQQYSSYMDSMYDEMNNQAFEIEPDFLEDNGYEFFDNENISVDAYEDDFESKSLWYSND